MFDVYLESTNETLINEFKAKICSDISIFHVNSPIIPFEHESEQMAKEFYYLDTSKMVVFIKDDGLTCLDGIKIGDAVGHGKQVILLLNQSNNDLGRYCEYRGVTLVSNVDELVLETEEHIGQLEMCSNAECK